MVAPKKIKPKITIWSSNSTTGIHPKEFKTGSHGYIYTSMFMVI